MLDFTDAPYQFFPARPNPVIMWICQRVVRRWVLPGSSHRVRDIQFEGEVEALRDLSKQGRRILFVPNHGTHSDPQLMTEVHRQFGTPSCFMAAYDVFLRGKIQAWLMQRNGAFSVDREGSDRKAMAAAMDVLKAGRYALTIFPEGNVYMMNDRVTPFLDGASFLALKAQKDLGAEIPIHAVPVSMKFTHLTDVRPAVMAKLEKLAAAVKAEVNHDSDSVEELIAVGRRLLAKNLRQRGYLSREEEIGGEHLWADLEGAAERIIRGLESKIGLEPKAGAGQIDRIRRIRGTIHQIRTDPDQEVEHRVAASWSDEAILALRILSYATPYVSENPTLDRFAETVEKLSEDLYSRWDKPLAERRAIVRLGAPIDLTDRLEAFGKKARGAVNQLTTDLESAVQAGLDTINASNEAEGAKPFREG